MSNIKKSRLRLNQKIEVRKDPDPVFFKSSIQELEDDTLSVTVPVRVGQRLMLQPGDRVRVQFVVDDASYYFDTTMLARKRSNQVALFVLARPSVLARVQRRDFVRFPAALNVIYQLLAQTDAAPEAHKGKTVDLSAGGVQIASSFRPAPGDKVQLTLLLEDKHLPELHERGEVAWSYWDDWLKMARFGVRFTDISEAERERIMTYIFSCMRRRPQV
ncbi:MAG: Flagellar brake protein YcgR [Syntrophomonadaceae bacterium]|nr:Flagellar brake protein YcgR [Bacillota bacterium]